MSARAEMDAAVAEPRYVIERGVPLPPHSRPKSRFGLTAELRKLGVGDCLHAKDMTARLRKSITTTANLIGIKVASRRAPEGGFRIWRIA